MTVIAHSDAMAELIDPDAEVQQLGTGFAFTEGPVWNREGGFLLFSDMPGDVRRSFSEANGIQEVMRPSRKGNGMVYDAHGRLLVCQHATSSLVREHADGTIETLATHYRGRELNSPNDVITRSDGAIYFSDPTYGRMPGFGVPRDQDLPFQGVYRIAPSGGDPVLAVGEDEFEQPNGLCFSPDESLLYVNDTARALIRVYEVASDGTLSGGRELCARIGSGDVDEGAPDGMKCDALGNLWVTGPDGLWVISAAGEHLGVIEIPEVVGNLAWGGPGWSTLYLPSSTSLYRVVTRMASAPLPYH